MESKQVKVVGKQMDVDGKEVGEAELASLVSQERTYKKESGFMYKRLPYFLFFSSILSVCLDTFFTLMMSCNDILLKCVWTHFSLLWCLPRVFFSTPIITRHPSQQLEKMDYKKFILKLKWPFFLFLVIFLLFCQCSCHPFPLPLVSHHCLPPFQLSHFPPLLFKVARDFP